MLTVDLLGQIEGLSDEQKQAIAQLSKNDENATIGVKLRETHDKYDETFASIFGTQKPSGEKSYSYWPQLAKEAFQKAESAKELDTKVKTLEEKLKSGASDEALKRENEKLAQSLADVSSKFGKLQTDYQKVESDKMEAIKQARQENIDLQFDNNFSNARAGVKFKPGIPQEAIEATLKLAAMKVKSLGQPEFIDREGKKAIIFRGENGLPVTNPDNLQNELTASEAYLKEISAIVDTGKQQGGGGSKGDEGGGRSSFATIGDAKTRVEANRAIQSQLSERGITVGNPQYQQEFQKAYTENNVAELPAQ